MQSLKNKWLQYLVGDTLRPESLKRVRDARDKMLYHQELLWADIPFQENAADVFQIILRLKEMAIALKSPKCTYYMDYSLRLRIIYGLEWLSEHRYNETCQPYGNWWYWEIGVPIALVETLLLMEELLDKEFIESLLLPVDKYVGDPAFHAQWFVAQAPPSTGANLVWKSTAAALTAVIRGDWQKLLAARNALLPLFRNASEGDGFYEDGSFIQHDKYAYTGGYGVSLLHDVVRLMVWLHGTPWELPDEARGLTAGWIKDSFVPLMFRGSMLDMVSGREVSREDSQNHESGHSVITACLRFSRILGEADQARLLSRVKGWVLADTYKSYIAEAPPDTAAETGALLDDELVQPAPEASCCKLFAHMDRVVLQGPGFAYSISMFSSRTFTYESINREHLKGWYTAYGMSHLYNSDLGQYADAYWPTVDPYRLPGTTVTKTLQEDGAGQGQLSNRAYVGGAVLHNQYGAIAMELQDVVNEADGLTALKSWFLFGNRIVALGSDIKSCTSARVETIIENRQWNPAGDHTITADGTEICRTLGLTDTLQPKWIHMAGSTGGADVGIYLPERCCVHALREARQGSWRAINDAGSSAVIERFYQTLWFDHGAAPQGDTYAYVLLPGWSEEATAGFAGASSIRIVELNHRVHAVEDSESGLLAVHFWQPGWYRSGGITCSGQASIVLRRNPAGWSLAIADPTQLQRRPIKVELELDRPVTRVIHKSERITVDLGGSGELSGPGDPSDAGDSGEPSDSGDTGAPGNPRKVRLVFDPDGAGGASFQVELGT
ncbi:polysaccharide lyase 8 family protein [Paenibacillus sp. FSL P2-0136]|uniref:polysaccharide lyase 8 family protein n=1 Tax=unclassified Paenibacillus TaxID=185978 RepID=UPI0030DBBFFD